MEAAELLPVPEVVEHFGDVSEILDRLNRQACDAVRLSRQRSRLILERRVKLLTLASRVSRERGEIPEYTIDLQLSAAADALAHALTVPDSGGPLGPTAHRLAIKSAESALAAAKF